jgi:hypothetical protein
VGVLVILRVLPVLLILAACGRTAPPLVPEADRTDRPRLVFTGDGHDFGRRERRETLEHVVRFDNGGREPLTIRKIDTHCGCAAALLSRRVIPPGGRGTIRITFTTGSVPGRRTKVMEVMTNDPDQPVSRYPVTCEVIGDAVLDPMVLAVRGTRSAGPIRATFDVVALDAGDRLAVTGVDASHPGIRATFAPIPATEKRKGFRVTLTFGKELGEGNFHERVTVRTNSRRDPQLGLVVIGSVRREVLTVPERLYFPPGAGTTVRSLFVSRRDGKALNITGIEDPSSLFDIEKRSVAPGKWEVRVGLSGESPTVTVRGSLVVRTDAAADSRVVVPFEIAGADR